jgi:hypothetical protein
MTRLKAIDDSKWPIPQRVDYMLVLAEMRGMEFQHRVDPALETRSGILQHHQSRFRTQDARRDRHSEAAAGGKEKSAALVGQARTQFRRRCAQARREPDGCARRSGAARDRAEAGRDECLWSSLPQDAAKTNPELVEPARSARRRQPPNSGPGCKASRSKLPAHAGVGRENYDWYLQATCCCYPYTSAQVAEIGEREYQRQVAFLKIEEHRNRAIPMTAPVQTRAEFDAKRLVEDNDLLRFLRDGDWMTIPDYVKHDPEEGPYVFPFERDPDKPGLFDPPLNLHFFFQAEFRDGRPLRAHNLPGHAFDQLQYARDTRPIRGGGRLFFVNGIRAEGWAFYLEEFLIQSGMLEDRPKAREIDYILGAKRAARILPELKMQANEWTWKQANVSLISRVPKWMQPGDAVAQFDIELYLRQPGYGIGYYMGKIELEKLLADVAMQEGDTFDIKSFHDRFRAAGSIPISLIRWEMTGKDNEVRTMR